MSYALLFSGQGGQHGEMFPWLENAPAAQKALSALAGIVGAGWREQLRQDTWRSTNAFAQPVIVGAAVAAWDVLRSLLDSVPEVVAGYSVGELAAFSAAGVIDSTRAIALAARRAALMDSTVAHQDTGLLAISGVTEAEVTVACPALECAIRIEADNNVYGGVRAALAEAQHALAERAKFKPLCVALASHTSWMRPAQPELGKLVAQMGLQPPECPVALDATGATSRDVPTLAHALVAQIGQCVEWRSCMAAVAERRPACVLEIGGGQALSRMWAARFADIPVRSLDEFRTAEGAVSWISRHS
jgi:[acyl-carrier-protein] S-malonyltransferase